MDNYYGYIYLTTNIVNNKKYIGQHKSNILDESYLGSGKLISKAIHKYGKENFKIEILEWCMSEEELNEKEILWISKFDASNNDEFYNIARGGGGHTCDPWNKGKHGVQEWTSAMEKAFELGRHLPASEKLKAKLRDRKNLVEYTDEYRNKLSKAGKDYNKTHKYFYLVDSQGKRHRILEDDIESLELGLSLGWKRMEVKKSKLKK